MTSKNQEWLLTAAKDARDFLEKFSQGRAVRGLYDDIRIGRNLSAAIEAVENDVIHEASKMLEVGRH